MPKQKVISNEAIASALLSCGSQRAAAAKLGIGEKTIYDRMRDGEFLEIYAAAKADLLRTAEAGVALNLTRALNTVAEIMDNKANNPAVRLQAAQTIINSAVKLTDKLTEREQEKLQQTEKNDDCIERIFTWKA